MVKKIFFLSLIIFLFAGIASALPVPNYKGRVNDFAGMLKSDQIAQLEKKIEQYEASTSNQVAILTVPSLEGDDLEGFSIRVVESWKVGQKGKDNGVLILVVLKDRKMRIEVGRGLEGSLTDLVSGRIVDGIMKPAFKEEAYYKGLDGAISAIQLAIKGEFKADALKKDASSEEAGIEGYFIAYVLIFAVAAIIGMLHSIFGGLAGGAGTYFVTSWLFNPGYIAIIIITVSGFLIGLVAKFILEAILESSGGGGGYSGGGYSSGGGFGGSSSFSFGGGSFGGGGASGSW